jgi:hypothetical protein
MNLVKSFLILPLCLLLRAACVGQNVDTNLDEFVPALASLKKAAIKESLSDFELAAAKMAAKASRPEDSWPSIMRLWVAQQRDFVELLWWQKDDRETRAFIVALYWCSHPPPLEDAQHWPASVADFSGHAGRFASPEKELRVDETRLVRKHLSAIAKELAEVLEKSKASNVAQLAKRYADVARKGEGEPLPKLAAVK